MATALSKAVAGYVLHDFLHSDFWHRIFDAAEDTLQTMVEWLRDSLAMLWRLFIQAPDQRRVKINWRDPETVDSDQSKDRFIRLWRIKRRRYMRKNQRMRNSTNVKNGPWRG